MASTDGRKLTRLVSGSVKTLLGELDARGEWALTNNNKADDSSALSYDCGAAYLAWSSQTPVTTTPQAEDLSQCAQPHLTV